MKKAKSDICPKCEGTGSLNQYAHIHSGTCFQCRGTGKKQKRVREILTTYKISAVLEATGERVFLYSVKTDTEAHAIDAANFNLSLHRKWLKNSAEIIKGE